MRTTYLSIIALAFAVVACSDDGDTGKTKKDGAVTLPDQAVTPDSKVTQKDSAPPDTTVPQKDSAPPKDSAPIGTLSMDEICTPGGSGAKGCKSGLLCVTFGTADGLCLPSVASCTTGTCATGRVCLSLSSGKGVCAKDCATASCSATTECQELKSVSKKVCTPPYTGPKTFGQICKSTDKTYYCKKGLTCLREKSTSTSGYCAEDCTTTACPKVKDSSGVEFTPTCYTLSSGSKFCVFYCDKTGQTCPAGLSCKTVSTTKLCLAP